MGMVHIIPACVGLPGANSAMARTASFRTSESVSRSRAATALAGDTFRSTEHPYHPSRMWKNMPSFSLQRLVMAKRRHTPAELGI